MTVRRKRQKEEKRKARGQILTVAETGLKYNNLYFHNDLVRIYHDDILKIRDIDDGSIDLIITSPPYNVDIQYGIHNDKMSYEDYLRFTKDY